MFHFRLENSFKHTTTTVYAALFYDLPTPVYIMKQELNSQSFV